MTKNAVSKDRTVVWWVLWITASIGSFFLAYAFWTPWIASRFGSVRDKGTAILWVALVFGSWLVLLLPLIIVMYQKVDKAYEDARIRREQAAMRFRSIHVERGNRLLPEALRRKLQNFPKTLQNGHLVDLILKDNRRIPNVLVVDSLEILGIYDQTEMSFSGNDVCDAEPVDMSRPPFFTVSRWLRLDAAQPQV